MLLVAAIAISLHDTSCQAKSLHDVVNELEGQLNQPPIKRDTSELRAALDSGGGVPRNLREMRKRAKEEAEAERIAVDAKDIGRVGSGPGGSRPGPERTADVAKKETAYGVDSQDVKSDGSADTDDIDGTDNPNGVVLPQTRGVAHGPNVGVGPKPAARAKNHETGDWSELSSSLLAKTASSIVAELGRISAAISGIFLKKHPFVCPLHASNLHDVYIHACMDLAMCLRAYAPPHLRIFVSISALLTQECLLHRVYAQAILGKAGGAIEL